MALSKKQIKQLRALANHLNPQQYIGRNNITDAAVKQAQEALETHELMKFAIQEGSSVDTKEAAAEFAQRLGAEVVQTIGYRFVLYKPTARDDVKKIELVRG